jgi:hypothetical protein
MDLPSSRELELEALLRRKDSQLAELTVRFPHSIPCPFINTFRRIGRGQHPPTIPFHSAQSLSHGALVVSACPYIPTPYPN